MSLAIRLALAFLALCVLSALAGYAGHLMTQASDLKLWVGIGLLLTSAIGVIPVASFACRAIVRCLGRQSAETDNREQEKK